jgi:hypothetical protein
VYTFSRADAVCEGQREQCNWQGGVWLSKKGEVSPGGRDLVDAKGEFEMEMGMKTGEGEREEEKDGMGIIIIQHQALAIWGDLALHAAQAQNEATFFKMVRCSSFAGTAPASVPCQLVPPAALENPEPLQVLGRHLLKTATPPRVACCLNISNTTIPLGQSCELSCCPSLAFSSGLSRYQCCE